MKHEDKKHFDVSKPRRHGPDPTSKPIIVGHHPMMPDPMIKEERKKAAKPIKVISEGDEPEPAKPVNLPGLADKSAPHETSPALAPSAQPIPQPKPPAPDSTTIHSPGAVFPPSELPPESSARPPEQELPESPAAPVTPQPSSPETKPAEQPPELPAGQELHIPAGHTDVNHKPRIWVWVIAALIILVWIYAAVDALTDTKLPFEFFQNLSE